MIKTLKNYPITDFEPVRNYYATEGILLLAGSLDENVFFENHLKKALKYAQSLEIVDYLCGEKYGANYEYTLKKFLAWLKKVNAEDLTITFNCGFPDAKWDGICTDDDLVGLTTDEIEPVKQKKLSDAINSYYGKSAIKVVCYDTKFAHDRFIITDQVAFSIGIGMDFLDRTGKIRDISINFKDAQLVKSLLPVTT